MSTTTTTSSSFGERLRAVGRQQFVWAIVAIVLLLVINVIKDPTYLSVGYSDNLGGLRGNLVDILRASAPILMIATGMALVIATGGIDLSIGSAMVIAGAVAMEFLSASGSSSLGTAALALLLALLVAGVLGVVNGVLVSVVGLQPFISTLIMMLAGRGIAKVITGGQNTTATSEPFRWIANGYVIGLPVVVLLAVVIVVAVGLIVRRSALGLMIEAIGIDAEAARLAGVNKRAIIFTVYVAAAVLGGMAGVFATASVMTVDVSNTGNQMELDAILAVVIGGTSLAGGKFSIRGAAVGAVLIATLDKTVVFLGVPSSATPAFKAAVIVILFLIQSPWLHTQIAKLRSSRTSSSSSPPTSTPPATSATPTTPTNAEVTA